MECTWGTWEEGKWRRCVLEWARNCSGPCYSSSPRKWCRKQRQRWTQLHSTTLSAMALQTRWSTLCALQMDESQLHATHTDIWLKSISYNFHIHKLYINVNVKSHAINFTFIKFYYLESCFGLSLQSIYIYIYHRRRDEKW